MESQTNLTEKEFKAAFRKYIKPRDIANILPPEDMANRFLYDEVRENSRNIQALGERLSKETKNLSDRITEVNKSLSDRITEVNKSLSDRISALEIRVSRLEFKMNILLVGLSAILLGMFSFLTFLFTHAPAILAALEHIQKL